jgi:DNA segregation ATPase FtsK/SpoIIIE, S-DNA-T family
MSRKSTSATKSTGTPPKRAPRARKTRANASRTNTPRSRTPNPPPPTWDEKFIKWLIPWRVELLGLLLLLAAVVTMLSLFGLFGWLAGWARLLRQLAGWGAFPLTLSLAVSGLHIMLRRVERPYTITPGQIVGFELLLLATLPLSHLLSRGDLSTAYQGRAGGLIGWALAEPLVAWLGPFLSGLLILSLLVWGLALLGRVRGEQIISWLQLATERLTQWAEEMEQLPIETTPIPPAPTPRPTEELIVINEAALPPARPARRPAHLPPLTLLHKGSAITLSKAEIDRKKQLIEQCLADFGLPAAVTEIRRGPAVTQFGVQPGYIERTGLDGQPHLQKVRVGQISALQRDLALALAAPRLRIQAPVPGRGIVGIEVPNADTSVVRLRDVMESEAFRKLRTPLVVGLGWDVTGAPVVTDLAKLPHLLIAGTTGSGKSVCLNAIITCLVFNNSPEQLQLVMIDPKKVELIRFNGLPHLLGQVEVEAERVIGVLQWLTTEMDRRYQMFTAVGARNITDYNRIIQSSHPETSQLPYMVIFVDELADLIITYPADVERTLCRLAQMARATGMHLVVATQRPSTDVITGLIKANFPARASFAVTSGIDSRVILDTMGAEQLLGKGDMLFLPPDASAPLRVQSCFVTDGEIEAVVNYWAAAMGSASASSASKSSASGGSAAAGSADGAAEPIAAPPAPWEGLIARQNLIDDTDDMIEQAVALAQKYDAISASLLQRRLRIGYPRAARLMEALYEMGMVEDPKEGGRTRRTFVNEEDDDPIDEYLENDT